MNKLSRFAKSFGIGRLICPRAGGALSFQDAPAEFS